MCFLVPHDQVHAVAGKDLKPLGIVADTDSDGKVLDNLFTFVLPRFQRYMDVSLDIHLGLNLCFVGPIFRPKIVYTKICKVIKSGNRCMCNKVIISRFSLALKGFKVRLSPQKSLLECSRGDFSIKVYQIM